MKKIVYTPASPLRHPIGLIKDIFVDIWRNRGLIWTLFLRDLKAQHRQAFLGYIWLIIPPIATAIIWLMMNQQKIVTVNTGDVPYPVFVLIGTTIWGAFAATLLAPSDAIFNSREVFVKLNVSVEAFILAGVARAFFNLLIMTAVLFPLMLFLGVGPRISWLLFPVVCIMVLSIGLTIGLALAPIGALYQDIKNAIGPILAIAMFTAPVVFPVPEKPGLLATVVKWNPLTPGIELARATLVSGKFDYLPGGLLWFALAILLVTTAFVVLRVSKPHIIARMGM